MITNVRSFISVTQKIVGFSQKTAQGQLSKNFQHKIAFFFLSISLNMCYGCSKEPSHQDSSFEYPQHMFWLRNKKNNFQLHILIWGPETVLTVQRCPILQHLIWVLTVLSLYPLTDSHESRLQRNCGQ